MESWHWFVSYHVSNHVQLFYLFCIRNAIISVKPYSTEAVYACFFLNWRIIALQRYIGFCYSTAWVSRIDTCVSSLLSLLPSPHHTPRGPHRAPSWVPCDSSSFPLAVALAHVLCICQCRCLNWAHPSHAVPTGHFSTSASLFLPCM